MEWIIGVIGVSATVIFGVLSWIRLRYPGRLTFVKEQTIELFDAIVKNLDEISILYKGQEIGHNLVLIKGAFVNSGRSDISPNMIDKSIAISIPKNFKWLTAKVISSSPDVKAQIELENDNTIKLNHGSFRCGEYIRFPALAEFLMLEGDKKLKVSLGVLLEELLQFTHRILNTRKIDRRTLDNPNITKKRRFNIILLAVIALVGLFSAMYFLIEGFPKKLAYNYFKEDGSKIMVTIQLKRDDMVKLSGFETNYKKTISFKEFISKVTGDPVPIKDKTTFFTVIILLIVYTLLPIIFGLILYFEGRRNTKLRRILKL